MSKINLLMVIITILQHQEISGLESVNVTDKICDSASSVLINSINLPIQQAVIEIEVPFEINSGDKLVLKIKSLSDSTFDIALQTFIGKFTLNDELNPIECKENTQNSVVLYKNLSKEKEVVIEWQSPTSIKEALEHKFYVTVIQSEEKWITYASTSITIATDNDDEELNWIYEGCQNYGKICYGIPVGCIEEKNCNSFGAVNYEDGDFVFELLSMPNHNYVSFGLSQSPVMLNTSLIDCVQDPPEKISSYAAWMLGRSAFRAGIDQTIITHLESRFIDGRIYCRVKRDTVSIVNYETFDLYEDQFYLLLASGVQLREDSVGSHGPNRGATVQRFSLIPSEGTTSITEQTPTTTTTTTAAPGDGSIYVGCGESKLCFGMPDGCVEAQNCNLLTTTKQINDQFFEFEMLSMTGHNYISFGLSQTSNMGSGSVIECVRQSSGISAYASWNYLRDNSREDVDQNIINLTDFEIIDGRIYCKVERNVASEVRGENFDLENDEHYLMIAGGQIIYSESVGPHFEHREISQYKHRLTNPDVIGGAPISPLILTHGCLMIIAWIGLTSIGIVFARSYKPLWPTRKILGKDIWFICHIGCMCLTCLLTLIGFIVIFVHVDQWSGTVHSFLGCIVFAFTILQVIGGGMRPDPKTENRPLFNYTHKTFGNVTHFLAILTIFYAVTLPAARLPDFTSFVLAGFAAYYILIHITLTMIDVKVLIVKNHEEKEAVLLERQASFTMLKVCILWIHFIITTLFVIGMILIFTLSK